MRKSPEPRPEPGIAEAAENAEHRIRVLQNRLAERDSGGRKEAAEDLEWELQKYFAAEAGRNLDRIRRRVIEGVVDKILRDWEGTAPLENDVVSRLVERIHERLAAGAETTSGSRNPGS